MWIGVDRLCSLNCFGRVNEQVLYWLSGLTCTDENFIAKSGAQRAASKEGIALIVPDTSPSQ